MRLTKQEKEWRAKDDAYSLMRAEEIKSDKTRLSAATREAKIMAREKLKEAKAAEKVASSKVGTTKRPRKRITNRKK